MTSFQYHTFVNGVSGSLFPHQILPLLEDLGLVDNTPICAIVSLSDHLICMSFEILALLVHEKIGICMIFTGIAQLGACRRYLRVVVRTLVPKVMEYSSMAAPIYASWGFDTDIYYERSYNSFYRKIPIPEEIVSSKVRAKMSNGVLHIELPKKNPTKLEEEEGTTVEIK